MSIIKILVALLIFTLIIVVHEMGHFLLAKKNGIGVTEFSIGMGPRLISFVKGGTRYSLKALPLGGSCAMVGEDEIVDREDSFNNKSVWARISVVAAGPIFNFILAFILAIFVIAITGVDKPYITDVAKDSPGYEAGIRKGDLIKSINGDKITIGRDVSTYLLFEPYDGSEIEIVVERDGEEKTFKVTPEFSLTDILNFTVTAMDEKNADKAKTMKVEIKELNETTAIPEGTVEVGDIITGINGETIANYEEYLNYLNAGHYIDGKITLNIEREGEIIEKTFEANSDKLRYYVGFSVNLAGEDVSVLSTIGYSAYEVKYWITTTLKSLGMIFTGGVSKDDIAGPVGIINIIGDSYEAGVSIGAIALFSNLANISILLTANLGVMNLLPLPALDGGRLVFLFIEAIRRKPINQKIEGMVHMIGLVLLLILMGFVMVNDFSNIFGK